MATTINADNGVSSGSAGLKQTADNSGSLVLQTNGTSALTIDTSQVVTFANPPTSGIQTTYSVRGLTGVNNSGTPNTQYDFSADLVVLINSNGAPIRRTNTGTITNNVSTAGPAANGRDQAGAFSAGSWIHFYFIWNGTTLATLSSATAPPTGPTLPTGYTHWAYLSAARFNASSQIVSCFVRGSKVKYKSYGVLGALSSGSNVGGVTNFTASNSAFTPPNSLTFDLLFNGSGTPDADTNTGWYFYAQDSSTNSFAILQYLVGAPATGGIAFNQPYQDVPYQGTTTYFGLGQTNISSNAWNVYLSGFRIPNGGE